MNKVLLSLAGLFMAANVFAVDTLDFGGPGTHTDAKMRVFVNADVSQPKCMNCLTFSVLVDDLVRGVVGTTNIDEVVVLVRHPKQEAFGSHTPYIHKFKKLSAVFRHMDSAHITEPFSVSLPVLERHFGAPRGGNVKDFEFQILALKDRCQNVTMATCQDQIMDVIADVTGKDILSLDAVSPRLIAQ